MQFNRRKRGFTLIEVILSISLFLMIGGIFARGISLNQSIAKTELDKFISDIETVRSANMSMDKDAKLMLYPKQSSYEVHIADQVEKVKLEHLKIVEWTFEKIDFYGSSWTKGNTIKLSSDGKKFVITVAAITGRIKIAEVK